jgi:RNA polymerase sigma-70 factor (ECF subfamily)
MEHDSEKCKEVFALLSEYLDLELPPEACVQIQAHIADCPPCVEFAESLRKTIELCRRYQPTAMPEPLSGAARDELRKAWEKVRAGGPRPGCPDTETRTVE